MTTKTNQDQNRLESKSMKGHALSMQNKSNKWIVPAFTDLHPFFPYITAGTRIGSVDTLFEGLLFCFDTTTPGYCCELPIPDQPKECKCTQLVLPVEAV